VITVRLTAEQLQLLIEVAEEVATANIGEIADPDLPELARVLLTSRTLALTALTEQLRQAPATPYVLSVDDLPDPGVLVEVKPFQRDGWFYIDLNTRGTGHSIGTAIQLDPAEYQVTVAGQVIGHTQRTEGALWLCLREWVKSPHYDRILALGRAHTSEHGQ
jgi:hypothetical protein